MIKITALIIMVASGLLAGDMGGEDFRRVCSKKDMVGMEKNVEIVELRLKVLESRKMHLGQTMDIITKASDAKKAEMKSELSTIDKEIQEKYDWLSNKYKKMTCRMLYSDGI